MYSTKLLFSRVNSTELPSACTSPKNTGEVLLLPQMLEAVPPELDEELAPDEEEEELEEDEPELLLLPMYEPQ
ncbi:MAG: hypothetical protein OSA97_18185 [Nevskia sp.]|nr:hypothetical protein [Nevskia sp.]